jgi:excisionase family DNA binding protein
MSEPLLRPQDRKIASPYMSVKQVAKYTTYSEPQIYKLIREGKLKAYRPSPGRILLHRKRVDMFIRSKKGE